MADLYVLASIPDQGKTTTAILLEKKLKSEGKRVACLQMDKGKFDVSRYLISGCYHYTVPLEASQGKNNLERWLPEGYDAFIFEITFGISPVASAYIDLFNNINEVISNSYLNNWKYEVSQYMEKSWDQYWGAYQGNPQFDLMWHWDLIHARNVQPVLTKIPKPIDGPCTDLSRVLYHADLLAKDVITPKMQFYKDEKREVIAVGAFPAEYWDIFPGLIWYKFEYARFMKIIRNKKYDLAIIGACGTNSLKLSAPTTHGIIICYQPTVYLDIPRRVSKKPLKIDFPAMLSTIKNAPVGTPLSNDGAPYSGYNNRYWTYCWYNGDAPVWCDENIIFCNGWVLPQYLIRDGYLEVN